MREQSLAGGAVAGLGNEGADAEGLVGEVAVDAEAAGHGGAVAGVVGGAAPAIQAELERRQLAGRRRLSMLDRGGRRVVLHDRVQFDVGGHSSCMQAK